MAAMDPAVAYPRAGDLAYVNEVRVEDSMTVHVEFSGPQPIFPDVFTDLAILPSHLFDSVAPAEIRQATFNREPIGNGPFRFVEYRPNQRWVFERWGDFPVDLGKPELNRFVVVIVDEATTKLAALTSGELDFAGINPAHARFVTDNPELDVIDYPVQFAYAMIWNTRRSPFDDPELRRALTMAVNRQLIVDAYLYGFGVVAEGPVSPEHPWYHPTPGIRFDPDLAGAKLDSLGWLLEADGVRQRNGHRLEIAMLATTSGANSLEQMVQAQLREVGVDATIRPLELSAFLGVAQSEERDFDVLVTGIPGDFALGFVRALFGGESPGPLAYSGFDNVDFDRALERAGTAQTESELRDAWMDAQRILGDEVPATWLYHARGVQGAARRVGNVRIDLRGELATLTRWRISQEGSQH